MTRKTVPIILGQECEDLVTGFKGVAIARTEWINGCARITLQPKVSKDGKEGDAGTFDEMQVKVIGEGRFRPDKIAAKEAKAERPVRRATGGPIPTPQRQKDPTR